MGIRICLSYVKIAIVMRRCCITGSTLLLYYKHCQQNMIHHLSLLYSTQNTGPSRDGGSPAPPASLHWWIFSSRSQSRLAAIWCVWDQNIFRVGILIKQVMSQERNIVRRSVMCYCVNHYFLISSGHQLLQIIKTKINYTMRTKAPVITSYWLFIIETESCEVWSVEQRMRDWRGRRWCLYLFLLSR